MRIAVIFYEHVAREYQSCIILKDKLEKKYNFTVYVLSYHFQIYDFYRLQKKEVIDVVVLPYAYKLKSILPIYFCLRNKKRPVLVNFHHEQIGAEYNEHRLFPLDDFTKNSIYHFSWTKSFENKLIQHGVNEKNIYVSGNIRTDIILNNLQKNSKNEFALKYSLDKNKKWILYTESGVDLFSKKQIKRMIKYGYKKDDLLLRNEMNTKSINETINQFNKIDKSFFDKYELIYRIHPGVLMGYDINPLIKVINEQSIYDWFNVIDMNISRLSTALFESELVGIPSYRLSFDFYPDKLITYGVKEFNSISNISEINDSMFDDSNIYSHIYERFIGKADGKCAERIATRINDLCIANDVSLKEKAPFKLSLLWIKKVISNKLSKYEFVHNHVFLKKYIKSLKYFKNDIPEEWKNEKKIR